MESQLRLSVVYFVRSNGGKVMEEVKEIIVCAPCTFYGHLGLLLVEF